MMKPPETQEALRAEVERAETKTAAEFDAHRMTKAERDGLRAERDALRTEVETLKTERDCWLFKAGELQKVVNGWESERASLKADNVKRIEAERRIKELVDDKCGLAADALNARQILHEFMAYVKCGQVPEDAHCVVRAKKHLAGNLLPDKPYKTCACGNEIVLAHGADECAVCYMKRKCTWEEA